MLGPLFMGHGVSQSDTNGSVVTAVPIRAPASSFISSLTENLTDEHELTQTQQSVLSCLLLIAEVSLPSFC